MRHSLSLLCAVVASTTALGQRIEISPESIQPSSPPDSAQTQPVTEQNSQDGPSAPRLQTDAFLGEPSAAPAVLDDAVPLPIPEEMGPSPEGDQVLRPASGDPFFLGFASGAYYPIQTEQIDPELVDAFGRALTDGRPTDEIYGFVMFEKRMTEDRVDQLESLGVRVLGFHPHYCLKAAIPIAQLDSVATMPFVRWVGVAKEWQKLHPAMNAVLADTQPGDVIKVWITVFDSDLNEASTAESLGVPSLMSPGGIQEVTPEAAGNLPARWMSNGWMQDVLEQHGVAIRSYTKQTYTFESFVQVGLLESLLELDFVQFIEPQPEDSTMHDESIPMIAADRTRDAYDGGVNDAAVIGHVDTGIDVGHTDLSIWGIGWSCVTADNGDMWSDTDGHGSHTAGTILGRGYGSDDYRGTAPGLASWSAGRLYGVKKYGGDYSCTWNHETLVSVFQASAGGTPIPHAVSNSWGSWFTDGHPAIGSEYWCRIIDDQVHDYDQAWIFAAGNAGSGAETINIEPSAKNVLTVGSVNDYRTGGEDPGFVSGFSSRGPCGDARWKPNLAAPGDWIFSCDAGSGNGYASNQGTSMACPHVAGVAEQLIDAYSFMRYSPQLLASWMMASAMTKDDVTISTPTASHLDNYGAGRVEAYKAMYATSDMSVLGAWDWNANSGSWYYGDFTIAAGTTRIAVVMHYVEPAASSGASQALVSDWDLWLDQDPIDGGGNTGEWFVQQSTVDNTEIRVLNGPQEGPWRFKTWPDSASGTVKMSVTVYAIYADTTPNGTTTLSVSDEYVQPNQDVTVSASVYNPDYVASALFVDSSGSSNTLTAATVTLKDGVVADLTDNAHGGRDILLGDLYNGTTRTAEWTVRYASEGVKSFQVDSRSDNWVDEVDTIGITVDGTPPSLVSNLISTTHTPGVWSNNGNITYTWTAATDALSGLSGYGLWTSSGGPGSPGETQDIGAVTVYNESLSTDAAGWWFNIRAVDRSGNWATHASTGGYLIDLVRPSNPTGLYSSTHTTGAHSIDPNITMNWTAAVDADSGLAGYRGVFDHSSSTSVSGPPNIGPGAVSLSTTLSPSTSPWYFHLRSKDVAGNYGTATIHSGPYYIDDPDPGTGYCFGDGSGTPCPCSNNNDGSLPGAGCDNGVFASGAKLTGSGIASLSSDTLRLSTRHLEPNNAGLYFQANNDLSPGVPWGDGLQCAGGSLKRLGVRFANSSGYSDTSGLPLPISVKAGNISPGDTKRYQCWYRTTVAPPCGVGVNEFNASNGYAVTWAP